MTIPANDDPAHPIPISRERQIELMEGAEARRRGNGERLVQSPAFQRFAEAARRRTEEANG